MSNPKKQHYVPQCYLREFRDPASDSDDPSVWIFNKDGTGRRRDKVRNVLAVNDLYTLKYQGQKNYVIEKTLSNLEGEYAAVFRRKIRDRKSLSDEEHAIVCLFVAVMLQRTLRFKSVIDNFMDQITTHVQAIEKHHGIPGQKSEELNRVKEDLHKTAILENAPNLAQVLQRMNMAFFCTDRSSAKFITSDDPCNLFNSDLQWTPFSFGGYGLAQRNIQVTLPISPEILLCLSWQNLHGYFQIAASVVQEQNRMTRGFAHKYFISHSPHPRRGWFRRYPLSPFFWIRLLFRRTIPRIVYRLRRKYRDVFKRN